MNYIITFPSKDRYRSDGWVRVTNAKDAEQVKHYANHQYGDAYSMIYAEEQFHEGYYPLGCLGEVNFLTWHGYVN